MLTPEQEIELISSWIETRDQKLLLKLIKAFEPLVISYARRYASYGIDHHELISVGILALVETANRFDPSKNFKFSTYASHWVKGMMLIYIANNYFSFTVKSQKMKHVFFTLRKLVHKEQKEGLDNMETMMTKLSEHFGCPAEQLEQMYQMIRQPNISLNEPLKTGREGEDGSLGDMIACGEPNPEDQMIRKSLKKVHSDIIYSEMERVLTQREKTIICGQLLTDEDHERTLQDLADEFALSRERVRQIRNNAYAKLERAIRNRCFRMERALFQ